MRIRSMMMAAMLILTGCPEVDFDVIEDEVDTGTSFCDSILQYDSESVYTETLGDTLIYDKYDANRIYWRFNDKKCTRLIVNYADDTEDVVWPYLCPPEGVIFDIYSEELYNLQTKDIDYISLGGAAYPGDYLFVDIDTTESKEIFQCFR